MAHDGKSGLQEVKNHAPDIILLDLGLPDIDGIEVCSLIRKDKSLHQVPIIVISARNDMKDISLAFKAGATDYKIKPVDFKALPETINSYLDNTLSNNQKTFLDMRLLAKALSVVCSTTSGHIEIYFTGMDDHIVIIWNIGQFRKMFAKSRKSPHGHFKSWAVSEFSRYDQENIINTFYNNIDSIIVESSKIKKKWKNFSTFTNWIIQALPPKFAKIFLSS